MAFAVYYIDCTSPILDIVEEFRTGYCHPQIGGPIPPPPHTPPLFHYCCPTFSASSWEEHLFVAHIMAKSVASIIYRPLFDTVTLREDLGWAVATASGITHASDSRGCGAASRRK